MSIAQAETTNGPIVPSPHGVRRKTPSPRGWRRALVRAAWTLAVLLVLGVVSHPWWLAPLVARDLAVRSGREVHFDAIHLGLTPQLAPVAVLRGVRIANAPWGDMSVPFAALDEARFEFAWHRVDGHLVVSKLVLRGGETHLERHPDGRRNWRLRKPDDRGPGRYLFDALEAHAASLSFRHPAIDLVFRATATDLPNGTVVPASSNAGGALTTRVVFDGSVRGIDYKGDVITGPELTFRDTGRWFPARGSAEVTGARLTLDGRAADMFLGARVEAEAVLDGHSLGAIRADASPRPFHVAGRLRVEPHRYALEAANAKVGGTDLRGDVAWSHTGERPSLRVRLVSEKTDAADLEWLAGRKVGSAADRESHPPEGPTADPLAAARALDADVAFTAAHLSLASFRPLQSLKVAATLQGGRLTVGDLDVGWAGGHTTGHAAVDLSQPLAASSIDVQTHGVHLETVLPQADEKKRITGTLAGTLVATASGNDPAAWRDSVSGRAALDVRDGTISSLLDAELGLEAGKLVRTVLSGAEPLAMPCAAATVTMQGGRGTLRELVIDSANTRTTGSGTIDLRDETIDLVLTPQPKHPGIDLDRSIRLRGHLPKPDRSLVDRVAQPAVAACPATTP